MRRPTATALLLAAFASGAAAQVSTILPFHRTSDLLIGDATSGRVLRADDLNGDGDFDELGELTLFFDPLASVAPNGIPYGPIGVPAVITMDMSATIYVAYSGGGTPRLLRMRDVDGDGVILAAGESSVFANGALLGFPSAALHGVVADPQGTVWLSVDGAGFDRVLRLRDLNGDGDAHTPGESFVAYDDATATAAGNAPLFNAAWLGTLPDGALYLSNAATFHQFVVRLQDASFPPNGTLHDNGDVGVIYAGIPPAPGLDQCFAARLALDGRFFFYNSTSESLIVGADTNGNGAYDDPGEATVFASSGDGGIAVGSARVFDIRDDGAVVVADGGFDRKLVLWRDLDGDGLANGIGEQSVALAFAASAFPTTEPRSVFFRPKAPAFAGGGFVSSSGFVPSLGWDPAGGLPKVGNASFRLRVGGAPASTPLGLVGSTVLGPVSLGALLPTLADPGCLIHPSIAAPDFSAFGSPAQTDVGGDALVPLAIPPIPSLAGAEVHFQAILIDLGSALPIVTSDALTVTVL